jgi:Family of unknown function (DUF6412)
MARAFTALSVLAFLLLGAGVVADEPGLLLALVGAALWALGAAHGPRVTASGGAAIPVPGRCVRRATQGASRQHHPDSAGRPRPRAPGRALPAT